VYIYCALATIFTRFSFELFETDASNVGVAHAYPVSYPNWEFKGMRMIVKPAA
jgi:hypothetical protein